LFQDGQNSYWEFPADYKSFQWQCSLVHGFLKAMQDFGMVMKMSKITNVVDANSYLNSWHDWNRLKIYFNWSSNESSDDGIKLKIGRETIKKSYWKILENMWYALGLFWTVWPTNRRLLDCKLVKSLFNLWMMIIPCLTQS
jgi:hypothetical protein